jgi:hypothetical protein
MFEVTLERLLNGSACGSTHDVIEAANADEAVEQAQREWRRVEPRFTFAPLLVIEQG